MGKMPLMKFVPALLVAMFLSCGGVPVSPEAEQLVPLIKVERFDKAASDPDHLTEAFLAALQQMEDEKLDPARIVSVADYFFDHYPFCVEDLPIDEADFDAVARIQHRASRKLIPALPACHAFEEAPTLQDMTELMRSWKGMHEDGGRCLRRVHDLYLELRGLGFDWPRQMRIIRAEPKIDEDVLIGDLFLACLELQPNSPFVPLIALSAATFSDWASQGRRSYALEAFREHLGSSPRWARLYESRVAWVGALRQSPRFNCRGLADVLSKSSVDPKLRRLGDALGIFTGYLEGMESGATRMEDFKSAVDLVVLYGKGTPFPDMARHAYVFGLAESKRVKEGEAWLKARFQEFEHPFHACYAALHLAFRTGSESDTPETRAKVVDLARFAISLDPEGSSAVEAWYVLAQIYQGAGREVDAIHCLESALAREKTEEALYEDETADLARSNASQMLGRLLLKREAWQRAFDVWADWDHYTGSGTTPEDWVERFDSMALCLEKQGRPRDALTFHWRAAVSRVPMTRERAQNLKIRYEAQGMAGELKSNVRATVESIQSRGNLVREDDGLRWLAEQLGVAVR